MLGTKLGAYEIREEIGHGGMAAVYRAYQPAVDRDVAIKVILKGIAGHPGAIQRFQREARLIARLEHPHVLPVYDFDSAHEPPYIVMRYLDGGTLREVMAQGLLPLDEVAHLMRQVCSALDYAHRQGIVHRDIKPSNILIDREGNAFVSDFGLARLAEPPKGASQITDSGAIMGTPDYMSPEQASGEEDIDTRADLYALGVMLFQMLTGDVPFNAAHPAGLLMMHIQAPVPSALALRAELPAEIDPVLQRAMAKDRDERYATAAEFGTAVSEALGSTASTASRLREAATTSSMRRVGREKPGIDSKKTPSEQNKTVTALYVKATDYAELIEASQGSEAVRGAMHAFWSACQEVIEGRGGMVASRTDTELLALWGTEASREDDAEQAVRTALDMQDRLRGLAGRLLDSEDALPLNFGVNSGLALISPDNQTGSISVSGTTINIANRLMVSAEGRILVTQEVFRRTLGVFDLQPAEGIKLRGRADKIDTYSVLLAKPRSFRLSAPTIEGVETEQIGREAEFKALQKALASAIEDGETQAVTVVGEAGIGKSRLLYEFDKWVELRPETIRVFQGRATADMIGRPYGLIRNLISFRCEIQDNDPPDVVRQKMETGIASLVGEEQEMAHTIGYLCGFDFNDSPHIKGLLDDAPQIVGRARQLFVRLFATLAGQEPVTLALDDIHLADDPSLDLLNELFAGNPNLRLMAVVSARPALYQRRPTWGSGQSFHHRLALEPLDKRDSRDLVREILKKVPEVPRALRDELVERAEGNPYYLEELIKTLLDDRVILKESDDLWRVEESRLGTLALPSTLVGLLESRLDTLLYPEKLSLQRAAVVGRVFYDTALAALDEADEIHVGDLPALLEQLTSRGFIERREMTAFSGSIEYTFSSGLLRDALLNALLRRQVTRYNHAAAQWLTGAAGERVGEYALQIAEYYEKAGELDQAGEVLLQAGERAEAVSAYAQAAPLLERALALLPDTAAASRQRGALKLIDIYRAIGNHTVARRNAALALSLARARGDHNGQAQALLGEATLWLDEGDLEQTEALLHAAEGLDSLAPAIRSHLLYYAGFIAYLNNDLPRLLEMGQASLTAGQESGLPLRIYYGQRLLAMGAERRGDYAGALQLTEEMRRLAESIGARHQVSLAYGDIAESHRAQGNYLAALEANRQAVRMEHETGNLKGETIALTNLALCSFAIRQAEDAHQYSLDALQLAHAMNMRPIVSIIVGVLAGVQALKGQFETPLSWLGAAITQPTLNDADRHDLDIVFHFLRETLSEAEIEQGLAAGESLDFEALVVSLLPAP